MAAISLSRMRLVVTLSAGNMVGEIALISGDNAKRNATVCARSDVEVLILDKKSFLDLDPSTLTTISAEAKYRIACSKHPGERTHADVSVLMARTAHLRTLSGRSPRVHYELCRQMVYRKVPADRLLVRKNAPTTAFYIVMSGTANAYASVPRSPRHLGRHERRSRHLSDPVDAGAPAGCGGSGGAGVPFSDRPAPRRRCPTVAWAMATAAAAARAPSATTSTEADRCLPCSAACRRCRRCVRGT